MSLSKLKHPGNFNSKVEEGKLIGLCSMKKNIFEVVLLKQLILLLEGTYQKESYSLKSKLKLANT